MKVIQKKYSDENGWETIRDDKFSIDLCNFVLVFGSSDEISKKNIYDLLLKEYPNAQILMNTTAGEIINTQVNDKSISLTAIYFEKTGIKTAIINISDVKNSFEAGKHLGQSLESKDLNNVFVISDGQKVNGSELVLGLQAWLPNGTIITGGLAGDGASFKRTLVGLNESPVEGRIVAIGFYGKNIEVTFGSYGGWDSFGPERLITKASANVLYELDGKPALDIYKMYLGDYAKDLPSSGLLFPLSIRNGDNNSLVRTILSVNEKDKSLTFAGNMPEGYYARLMKANFDRLIEGAATAAQNTTVVNDDVKPDLAILISCIGRKLVLGQRVEEEVEAISALFGPTTAITGFYSYGEISPSANLSKCDLHNQTMTITTFKEL